MLSQNYTFNSFLNPQNPFVCVEMSPVRLVKAALYLCNIRQSRFGDSVCKILDAFERVNAIEAFESAANAIS
jgi:hypothetical protein